MIGLVMEIKINEILLDCRELQPPEPLTLVVSNLNKLSEWSYIKMLHRIEPTPLLNMLKLNGCEYIIKNIDSEVIIYIYNRDSKDIINYIESL